ncbi:RNA methyltransferase, partial [Oscillochloris sp. ZM17-4]|uniref:TrmH family RNA methyltransferase n=1 Tax=Oscillochloris sp. ZM17-4 TaxID=2866714 RepID=UPI001C735E1F
SSSNPTIRQIRALRQRKERERTGLCFVEGVRLVGEAVQLGVAIEALVVAPALLSSPFAHNLVARQSAAQAQIIEVSAEVFTGLSQKDGPQGLAAVARQRWVELADVRLGPPPGWVALVEPADPGNLGTILRTADAVGASGVILIDNATDPYDPAAMRASMGATFAVQLARASFAAFAAWKRASGAFLIGASDKAPAHYQDIIYPQPAVLLMGSERQGLGQAHQDICDQMVHLPMRGRSDSLNLAVATGVLLYELLSQSRWGGVTAQ